jgi:hypothetical protein
VVRVGLLFRPILVVLAAADLVKAQQILGLALQVKVMQADQLLVQMRARAVVAAQAQLEAMVLGQ